MATLLLTGLVILLMASAFLFFNQKKSLNEKSQTYKKKSQLLRFTRGNKALTPAQQEELKRVTESNLRILKQQWKDEHL